MTLTTQRLLVLVLVAFGKSSALFASVAAARYYSGSELGAFFVLVGLVALGGTVTNFGLDQYAYRFVPESRSAGDDRRIVDHIAVAIAVSALGSVGLSFFIFTTDVPDIIEPWMLVGALAVCIFASALRRLSKFLALIDGKTTASVVLEMMMFNLLMVALVLGAWSLAPSFRLSAIMLITIASVISGLGSMIWVFRHSMTGWRNIINVILRGRKSAAILAAAAPTMLSQLWSIVFTRGDVLLLASLSTLEEASRYSVALRITYFLTVINEFVTVIYGKRMAEVGHEGDPAQMKRLLVRTIAISTLWCVPMAVILCLFGEFILAMVYGDFAIAGYVPLVILVIGRSVAASLGSSLILLTSMGLNRELALGSTTAGLLFITASILLVPSLGATGLAIGTTIGLCAIAANILWLAYRRLR